VPRPTQDTTINIFSYLYGTITLFRLPFQVVLVRSALNIVVLQPQNCRNNFGLGFCAFARHYSRNHFCFLLLRLLRCFSSAGSPPIGYYVFNIVGCPIRISTDQFVCANPRSFSQLITSFFASESLGIPHTPLFCLLFSFLLSLVNIFIN
jgi:hypothetical protein